MNQIPWSPARDHGALLAADRELHVVVEGYSPLKGTDLADLVLTEIAGRHGVTPAQVVLRWHLEHGIPVIPKSAQPTRIKENIDLVGFSLTPDEVAEIDAVRPLSRSGHGPARHEQATSTMARRLRAGPLPRAELHGGSVRDRARRAHGRSRRP